MRKKISPHFFAILCSVVIITIIPFAAYTEDLNVSEGPEMGIRYTVKKGDTLWDISEKFFGSPWVWPELWEMNSKQVMNPHLIFPGNRLHLFRHKQITVIPEAVEEVKAQPEELSVVVEEKTEPVEEPEVKIEYYKYPKINSVGYFKVESRDERKANLKENRSNYTDPYIFKVKDDKVMISTGDRVYIRQNEGDPLILGSRHTVFRAKEHIDDETRKYIGTEYIFVGIVEIVLSNKEGYFEGIVKEAYRQIELYDRLTPSQIRSPKIALEPLQEKGSGKSISGKIISAADYPVMFSETLTAYIDKGSKDGVKQGQQYSIYAENSHKGSKTKEVIHLSPTIYGTFIVLDTKNDTSTIIITNSTRSISNNALFSTKFLSD